MKVRWNRVLIWVGIGQVVLLAGIAIAVPVIHNYRVWASDGVWCATTYPDGSIEKHYGAEACDMPE